VSDGRLPPSAKKLREARARGLVAHSPLLSAAASLAAGAAALALTARPTAARLLALARHCWGEGAASTFRVADLASLVASIVLPVVLSACIAGWVVGLVQTGALFSLRALARRGPFPGDDRALPTVAWAAAAALVLIAVGAARSWVAALAHAEGLSAGRAATVGALASWTWRALVLLALAGVADWAWRRVRLHRSLAMTRAERERERREDEGDPRLRAEHRRRQRALARDPLVDEVARAQVVVTAAGIAVALAEIDGAARVVTAAPDNSALRASRLNAVARRLGVPVRADDLLAAALAGLPPNAPVPPAHQTRALQIVRATRRRARAM
jgi:flagellar biosynthesis protein FlhB